MPPSFSPLSAFPGGIETASLVIGRRATSRTAIRRGRWTAYSVERCKSTIREDNFGSSTRLPYDIHDQLTTKSVDNLIGMPLYNLLEDHFQRSRLAVKVIIEQFVHFAALRRDPIFTLKKRRSINDERQEMKPDASIRTLYRLWTA